VEGQRVLDHLPAGILGRTQKLVLRKQGNSQEVEEDTSFQGDIRREQIEVDLPLRVVEVDGQRMPLVLAEDTLQPWRYVDRGMSADRRRIQAGKEHLVAVALMPVRPVEHIRSCRLHHTSLPRSEVEVQEDHADKRIQASAQRLSDIERSQVDHAAVVDSRMSADHRDEVGRDDSCHHS
jgi:hypothetical protein